MSQVELKRVIELLKEFTRADKNRLQVILLGGLALQYYGMKNRATVDIDAEVRGDIEGVFNFLRSNNIPADIGENVSGWSVVGMPPGYRERVVGVYRDELLQVNVLHPLDFVIAKLRRFTEEDIEDALFVVKKYNIRGEEIETLAETAIQNSPKDTALFVFRRNIDVFVSKCKASSD